MASSREGREPPPPQPIEPAAVLDLTASPDGPLREGVRISLARSCTTLVGPNAAGKAVVLDAIVDRLRADEPGAVVVHIAAGSRPIDVVRDVVRDAAVLVSRGGTRGRGGSIDGALAEVLLDEARQVVPEVAKVVVDVDAALLSVRDRHGQVLSTSAGLRASLALALGRVLAEQGVPVGGICIEEPGAFLHPAAQELLRDRLVAVAGMVDAPVVVTSETPFVIPRTSDDLVIAMARDEHGNPIVIGEAVGDDPHASVIGGLFRDPGLGAVLDRAARLVPGTRAIVVFEGGTDEAYLQLAADALGRSAELAQLAVIPAGGASAAALQAVVLRAETDLPLLVVLDNDDPGRNARDTLVKRLGFAKRTEATTFAEVLPGYPPGTEAEDLFDHRFLARFVEEFGPEAISARWVLRKTGKGGEEVWHFDLTSAAKGAFVRWARRHATTEDVEGWARLLDILAERLA